MHYVFQTVRGLLFLSVPLFLVGCGGGKPAGDAAAKGSKGAEADDHHHHHHHHHGAANGPHKGFLVELGAEEYHGEVVHDDAAHRVTIFILDGKPEKNVPIAQKEIVVKLQDGKDVAPFTLPAKPLDDEKDGKSSRFELVDEKLAELMDKPGVTGQFNVTIGKPFIGKFTIEKHEEESKETKK